MEVNFQSPSCNLIIRATSHRLPCDQQAFLAKQCSVIKEDPKLPKAEFLSRAVFYTKS